MSSENIVTHVLVDIFISSWNSLATKVGWETKCRFQSSSLYITEDTDHWFISNLCNNTFQRPSALLKSLKIPTLPSIFTHEMLKSVKWNVNLLQTNGEYDEYAVTNLVPLKWDIKNLSLYWIHLTGMIISKINW